MPTRRPLEKHIQNPVVDWARRQYKDELEIIKLTTLGAYGASGWPDLLFLAHGRTMFVESKAPGEEPTPLQLVRHHRLRKLGFTVHVCSDKTIYMGLINTFVRWARENPGEASP